MIAALRHSLIPLAPTRVPEFRQEPRPGNANAQHGAGKRQGRRALDQIIDPYLHSRFVPTSLESTQIYDHCCTPVFVGPPSLGRLVDIYA
jgi:hypothetical protein